jgi:hypothetical protein
LPDITEKAIIGYSSIPDILNCMRLSNAWFQEMNALWIEKQSKNQRTKRKRQIEIGRYALQRFYKM